MWTQLDFDDYLAFHDLVKRDIEGWKNPAHQLEHKLSDLVCRTDEVCPLPTELEGD